MFTVHWCEIGHGGVHRITQPPYGVPSCGWDSFIELFAEKHIANFTFASLGNSFSYNQCSCKNSTSQSSLVICSIKSNLSPSSKKCLQL